ncbi:DMT family transporter [Dechloromonas sp. XY25]|uniref:DMT family transporter n=1 Tax=Dechloromonas hankyongensis TaxID=2908002 RepID=A0ABS9K3W3_9RHOO|nr:DMT family transporter [Dechloromonas hankyongensis]MCG2577838.1 DMT family transporter [Dechloromonas hankyongensis]
MTATALDQTALLLVVTGALCHASWNLLAKKAAGGLPFVWLFGLVSTVLAVPFGIYAWIENAVPLTAVAWLAIAGSALMHLVYSLVLQQGYRKSDFSVVYPLARGTGPLFSVSGAILVLGEMPNVAGWIGILALLAGIFLISGIHRVHKATTPHAKAGLLWGSLTGLCIAAYTLLDGWAIKALGLSPLLFYVLCLWLRTLMLTPQALRDVSALRAEWGRNRKAIVAVGILSPMAYLLVLFAIKAAPLSYIAPLRELSMLIGVYLGTRVLREALLPSRLIGTLSMIIGVVLLALFSTS